MIVIRLTRRGAKKRPIYRIVVANQESPRDGKFIENIGTYQPLKKEKAAIFKKDRMDYWLKCGAQPSDTIKNLYKTFQKAV
ncbi:MAG: 30S ribosomal protein S16 [Deltaproteobacteria bacterium]|nr:30S ribosomal protein S16 [Deltaproteobacteria bacterium]